MIGIHDNCVTHVFPIAAECGIHVKPIFKSAAAPPPAAQAGLGAMRLMRRCLSWWVVAT